MIEIADFDIRYSVLEDLVYLNQWFSDLNSTDPFPFGEKEKQEALKNWIGFSRFKASLTGMIHDQPCAVGTLFLMPYRKVAHHCSFYLIVDQQHRRRGIGTAMVRNLLHLAKTRFKLESVHVEIFEPNPLVSILMRLGFECFARQENFVHLEKKQEQESSSTHRVGEVQARILLEHFF